MYNYDRGRCRITLPTLFSILAVAVAVAVAVADGLCKLCYSVTKVTINKNDSYS